MPCNEPQVLQSEDDDFGRIHTISTVIPSSDALDQSTQTDLMDLIAEFKSDHQSFDQDKLKQHVRLELAIPKIKSILNLTDTFNGLKTLIERGIEKNSSAKKNNSPLNDYRHLALYLLNRYFDSKKAHQIPEKKHKLTMLIDDLNNDSLKEELLTLIRI